MTKLLADMQLDSKQKEMLEKKLDDEQSAYLRAQRKKMTVNDFDVIAIIGRGAFGEVHPTLLRQFFCRVLVLSAPCLLQNTPTCLGFGFTQFLDFVFSPSPSCVVQVRVVRKKDTQEVFAMKIMIKSEMIRKNQVQHIRAERDLLSLADNPHVVKLLFSFQVQQLTCISLQWPCMHCSLRMTRDSRLETQASLPAPCSMFHPCP